MYYIYETKKVLIYRIFFVYIRPDIHIYVTYMHIRILTLPFDEIHEGFPDEVIEDFCQNKLVKGIQTEFFLHDGKAYWSVAIQYEIIKKETSNIRELDQEQRLLFQRLKEWRKKQADAEGVPAFIVATNAQLIYMIRHRCKTLECLKNLKGFGKSRVAKYGKFITDIIIDFYEKQSSDESS